jgi:hypothetical protein
MKKLLLISVMMLLSLASYSQTYKSSYVNKSKPVSETDMKDRIITISDKEITVTNFLDGGVKTWHLIINRIENKEWTFDGMQKTYYCTNRDKDIIEGNYRKAIAHKTSYGTLMIADFADEMTVFTYDFNMK